MPYFMWKHTRNVQSTTSKLAWWYISGEEDETFPVLSRTGSRVDRSMSGSQPFTLILSPLFMRFQLSQQLLGFHFSYLALEKVKIIELHRVLCLFFTLAIYQVILHKMCQIGPFPEISRRAPSEQEIKFIEWDSSCWISFHKIQHFLRQGK